jgi:Flp pilus assembly pilin Flp
VLGAFARRAPDERTSVTDIRFITTDEPGECGQALVEYALILGLVSVVCIAGLTAIGTNVSTIIQTVADALT